MRRMIAGAKKALHRNKNKLQNEDDSQPSVYHQPQTPQNTSIHIPPAPPDQWFILNLFTSKFVNIGKITEFFTWSQAGGHCALCSYILVRFIDECESGLPVNADVIVRWNTKDTAVKGGRKDEIPSFDFELSWGFPHGRAKSCAMNCFTSEDENMAYYITTRPSNPDIGSSAAFANARTWLAECDHEHTQCQQVFPGSVEMPTRILEILVTENGDYSVRLHDSAAEIVSYVALSYIWGGPQACQTLTSNIDEHKLQIPTGKLPRTIMDAVRCTNELGLTYLWVDSLCIIQDSVEDKAIEIGRMSNIYKNAYVTISAAKATTCEEGFLNSRVTADDVLRSSFKLKILTPKDPVALNQWIETYRVREDFSNYLPSNRLEAIFRTSPWSDTDAWFDMPSMVRLAASFMDGDHKDLLTASDIEDEPISKRGWTLQESWLSRRMLIYSSGQLSWRCRTRVQVDGGVTKSNTYWNIKDTYRFDENGEMIYDDGSKVPDSGKDFIFGTMWRDIVGELSSRTLSVAADKLNALEGIVQELRLQTGDEYVAGLWKQHLVSQLSWYQDPTRVGSESMLWSKERSCPSWSWIKTDGPVSFSYAENSRVEVKYVKILRNEMVGDYPNLRLEVDGGVMLRAPMSTLPITESLPKFRFPAPGHSHFAFTNVIFPDGALTNPELLVQTVSGEPVISAPHTLRFLELSWGKKDGKQNIADESRGLVLLPIKTIEGRENVYQRVGFFVVALEEDREEDNVVTLLSLEPRDVRPTAFGTVWKRSLKEEVALII
ncbi:hypothetical protein B7494_g308 [Chlorociboria aeruginascens]|nr:hypothetical protein B7494_g308 [Chlorociboria aeruginascens]